MKKAIAVMFLVIFAPIFILVVLYFSTSSTLLNAKSITQKFNDSNIYNITIQEVLPQINSILISEENIDTADETSQQALKSLTENLEKNVSSQWLKEEFEKLYTKIVNHLQDKDYSKEIIIDLSPISKSFSVSSLTDNMLNDEFLASEYKSTIRCTEDNIDNCPPSKISFEDFKTQVHDEIDKNNLKSDNTDVEKFIPEQYNFYEIFTIKDKDSFNFGQNMLDIGKNIVKNLNYAGYIMSGFLLAIIIIIILMFIKNPYFIFKSLGITFLTTSIIILLLSVIGFFSSPFMMGLFPLSINNTANLGFLIFFMISIIVSEITTKMIIIGIILLSISIIMLIFSKKYKPTTNNN